MLVLGMDRDLVQLMIELVLHCSDLQLRLHGGSNHYFLPTSLLQRAMIDAPASNAFAGGVVRVEATDLEWVGNTFAEHMGPRTLKFVREVGGVPAQYVWAVKATSSARATPSQSRRGQPARGASGTAPPSAATAGPSADHEVLVL